MTVECEQHESERAGKGWTLTTVRKHTLGRASAASQHMQPQKPHPLSKGAMKTDASKGQGKYQPEAEASMNHQHCFQRRIGTVKCVRGSSRYGAARVVYCVFVRSRMRADSETASRIFWVGDLEI